MAEEFASLQSLHSTATGKDLFSGVCGTMKELKLSYTKLKG